MVELILLIAFLVWLLSLSAKNLPQIDSDYTKEPWYKRVDKRTEDKREKKVTEDFFMRE